MPNEPFEEAARWKLEVVRISFIAGCVYIGPWGSTLEGGLKTARAPRKGMINEGGYMQFEEALSLAGKGELITRPGYGVSFAAIREGRAVYGHFIGETGFADVRAYVFTDEDKSAADWERFARVLPDAWEGCDVPNG